MGGERCISDRSRRLQSSNSTLRDRASIGSLQAGEPATATVRCFSGSNSEVKKVASHDAQVNARPSETVSPIWGRGVARALGGAAADKRAVTVNNVWSNANGISSLADAAKAAVLRGQTRNGTFRGASAPPAAATPNDAADGSLT